MRHVCLLLIGSLLGVCSAIQPRGSCSFGAPPLSAIPGNALVLLKWTPLTINNTACTVSGYSITYSNSNTTAKTIKITNPKATNATITQLTNGVSYVFNLQATSNTSLTYTSQIATATAIPLAPAPLPPAKPACNTSLVPSAPINLTSSSNVQGLTLCWGPPKTGCANSYTVAMRLMPLADAEASQVKWSYQSVPKAGCTTITGLQDRRSYQFAVQSVSNYQGKGGYAPLQAMYAKDWRCMPIQSFYPVCKDAVQGSCVAMNCAELAQRGLCGSPLLKTNDVATKTVIQYCSSTCPCASPENSSQVKAAEVASQDTTSWGNAANTCCKY